MAFIYCLAGRCQAPKSATSGWPHLQSQQGHSLHGPARKVLCKLFVFIESGVRMRSWKRALKAKTRVATHLSPTSVPHSSHFSPLAFHSVLMLPCKFSLDQLWTPNLSTLHTAKEKQMLLLSIKSSLASPVAGGSALSMGLVDRSRGVDLRPGPGLYWNPPLANQPVSHSGWQTPWAAGYSIFISLWRL